MGQGTEAMIITVWVKCGPYSVVVCITLTSGHFSTTNILSVKW